MKLGLIMANGLTTGLSISTKLRVVPYEGERGVHFMDIKIKKMLKIDIFIFLCNNSVHNRAFKLKI